MNFTPQHEQETPPAEWHGGVAEHGVVARSVSESITALSPSLTQRATKTNRPQTGKSIAIWLVLWSLPLLMLMHDRLPIADDLGAYHLPLRSIYQSSLQLGENWTWCPWNFCGYHVHGEGQLGGDHPLHQVLYRAFPLILAFGLECWWAYPATFFGMWWWLRQLRFSTAASQVAGLALSLCGFMTLRIVHLNAIQVIAHIPWLLGCLTWLEHRARRSTSLRSLLPPLAFSALLTGSQLLLGYPQYVVFTLIAEGLWLVSLMLRSPNVRRMLGVTWLAAKALGLLLGASQVLPTLEYLSLSERANWSKEQMFEGSWPMLNLTQLVAPYLFKTRVVGQNTHELTIFVGIVTVCLALLGLVNHPRPSSRVLRGFAIALCSVGLLLALGDMGPLAELTPYLPVWNQFRFPCRTMILFCLGLVLLALLGWQRVSELSRQRVFLQPAEHGFTSRENMALGLYVAAACIITCYATWAWPEYITSWQHRLIGPACAVVSFGLLQAAIRGGQHARNFLPLLLCLELFSYAMTSPSWNLQKKLGLIPLPKVQYGQDKQFTTLGGNGKRISVGGIEYLRTAGPSQESNGFRDAALSKAEELVATHSRIDGYAGVKPHRFLDDKAKTWRTYKIAGVSESYGLRTAEKPHKIILYMAGTPTESLPRGLLVTKTELAGDRHQQIEKLDSDTTALVEVPIQLDAPAPSDHLDVKLTADRPGRLEFDLATNRDALLVTTESFHPGWHARVDGADVPVLRVNGDFLGVRIPGAAQRVECYFSDNWHAVGRWISLGSLGLLGLVFCWSRTRPWRGHLAREASWAGSPSHGSTPEFV